MKTRFAKMCLLWAAATAVAAWAPPALAAATVQAAQGEVVILGNGGIPRVARAGERIAEGESIQTGADGQVLIATDDSGAIALRPGSRLLLEVYQAGGTRRDAVTLRLLQGAVRVSAGWVARQAGQWRLAAPSATLATQDGDQELRLGEEAAQPKTWLRQWSGEATLSTSAGHLRVRPGETASATWGDQPPQPEAAAPQGTFAPDPAFDALAQGARAAQEGRLQARRQQVQRSGGASAQGNPRISAQCTPNAPAQQALDALLRAYEQGDTAFLQRHIDPAMPGYGILINDAMAQNSRQRQTRLFVLDRQMQCGPDVSVIDFAWEKRYLDAATFQPVLRQGRASVLISALRGGLSGPWRVNGFAGDNPLRVDPQAAAPGPAPTPPSTPNPPPAPADMALATPTIRYGSLSANCPVPGPVSARVRVTAQVPTFTYTALPTGSPPAPYPYQCTAVSDGGATVVATSPPATAVGTVTVAPLPPYLSTVPLSAMGQAVAVVQGAGGSVQPFSATVPMQGQASFVSVGPATRTHTVSMNITGTCSGSVRLPAATPVCQPQPSVVPFSLTVRDAGRAGQGAVAIQVQGSSGDAEVLSAPAVAPGVFVLSALPVTQGAPAAMPGNGRLELSGPASFTLSYVPASGAPLVRVFNVLP